MSGEVDMQHSDRQRILTLLLSIAVWVMLPLSCIVHCAPAHPAPSGIHRYVCALQHQPTPTASAQLTSTSHQPHAFHVGYLRGILFLVVITAASAGAARVSKARTHHSKPAVPPPRLRTGGVFAE